MKMVTQARLALGERTGSWSGPGGWNATEPDGYATIQVRSGTPYEIAIRKRRVGRDYDKERYYGYVTSSHQITWAKKHEVSFPCYINGVKVLRVRRDRD